MENNFIVGERVVVRDSHYGCIDYIDTIKNITSSGNYKIGNGRIFNKNGVLRGGGIYHAPYLEKYTDEKFKEIRTKLLIMYLGKFDYRKLSFEKLNRIWEIIKEKSIEKSEE